MLPPPNSVRVEARSLVVPLKEREVHYPKRSEVLRVPQAEAVAHLDTQHAELGLGLALRAAEQQKQVAAAAAAGFRHLGELLRGIELVDA